MAYEPYWEIQGSLARSSRPGYSSEDVPREEVDDWLRKVKALGVKSIICLLTEEQIGFYPQVPGRLLSYYRQQGLKVEHIGITDPARDPERGGAELQRSLPEIYEAFKRLPKPVLVHCSAGQDRTGKAVAYIKARLAQAGEDEVG